MNDEVIEYRREYGAKFLYQLWWPQEQSEVDFFIPIFHLV